MKKLSHEIVGNMYYICEDGKVVFSIELQTDYDTVAITTPNEVWEGPIKFINLTADIDEEEKRLKKNLKNR